MSQNVAPGGNVDAPDNILLENSGRPWWYRSVPSATPAILYTRDARSDERPIIDRARHLMATQPARAIALMDGDRVVYTQFNEPASENSKIFGYSMGKTITAMAVGQALCQGHLTMDTKAGDLLPKLAGKALGEATVRDLLRMASGTSDSNADSTIWPSEQDRRAWAQGNLDLSDLVADDRISSAKRGIFNNYKPGELFSYKSTDPFVLGMMVSRATGLPWSRWVQESVLNPMGAKDDGFYAQDKQQNGQADSGMRMSFGDWMRFALWVKRQSREPGCFGNFVRSALSLQIRNTGGRHDRRFGKLFGGYGYLIWTDNEIVRGASFANGHGGQRISWSTDPNNSRMVIVISNIESWMTEVYDLVKDWNQLHSSSK